MRNDLDGSLNQPDDHQQNEKNGGRLAICAVRPANRSKKPTLLDTSLGFNNLAGVELAERRTWVISVHALTVLRSVEAPSCAPTKRVFPGPCGRPRSPGSDGPNR